LSESYILNAVYTYSGKPTFNKYEGTYNCGCPICHEGKSWGKKKRLYYYPKTKSFYCFNCNRSWSAKSWIHNVSGLSYAEMQAGDSVRDVSKTISSGNSAKIVEQSNLPHDSISLLSESQQKYYRNNIHFSRALEYVKKRRLDVAVNRVDNFFISVNDKYHKNRLILPFYNTKGDVIFYQTRSLDGSEPKYVGKYGGDKSVFNIDKIDPNFEYIFLFEGPIDAMFIRNGVALAGLKLTELQEKQLQLFPFHKKIWVIDNTAVSKDEETKKTVLRLLNDSQSVYRWNNQYKDFNEWCVEEELNEIPTDEVLKNLY